MELTHFFSPTHVSYQSTETIGAHIHTYQYQFPNWQNCDLILIGCPDQLYLSKRRPTYKLAEAIRQSLYTYSIPDPKTTMADLGNLKAQISIAATLESLTELLAHLLSAGKLVLLLSPDQVITYAQYMAYYSFSRPIEYVSISSHFHLDLPEAELTAESTNRAILTKKPSQIKQFTNLGFQTYLTKLWERELLKDQYAFTVRYGELYPKIDQAESYLRMADMVGMNLSSIRLSEVPGVQSATPGGFSAIEACQLARYAGLGYHLSSFSLSGATLEKEVPQQTSTLAAMILWYVMEGFYNRKEDFPTSDRNNLQKYTVQLHASISQITFYQHLQTARWWMEVPIQAHAHDSERTSMANQVELIPCSESDYQCAQEDLIPDRWWTVYHKLGG